MATDRRVRYTKMVLRESLIKQLQRKPIARITVKELCADADINRATYYAHYADQFDQLKQVEGEYVGAITSFLDQLASANPQADVLRMTEQIIDYIDANGELGRVLLGRNGNIDFLQNLTQLLRDRVFAMWRAQRHLDEASADYLFTFVAEGSIGVVRKWLFDEQRTLTAKEVAHLIVTSAEQGVAASLHAPSPAAA